MNITKNDERFGHLDHLQRNDMRNKEVEKII